VTKKPPHFGYLERQIVAAAHIACIITVDWPARRLVGALSPSGAKPLESTDVEAVFGTIWLAAGEWAKTAGEFVCQSPRKRGRKWVFVDVRHDNLATGFGASWSVSDNLNHGENSLDFDFGDIRDISVKVR
jgi:hypothetical protein